MSQHADITELLNLRALREAVIPLESEHFDRAIQLGRLATNENHQWRTYINGLALCGFVEWLEEHAPALTVQQTECSILQPQYGSVLNAVCNLVIGRFTLCLIVTESVVQERVPVPRAVVELPEFSAHLYVLLEMQEEQEQIVLRGCLRYDQLMQHHQSTHLPTQPDWTYIVPLDWFDPDSSHLLFYLQFLEPSTLALPAGSPRSMSASEQADLSQLLPQIDRDATLWEVLSWKQGMALLTSPALLNSLYLQHTKQSQSPMLLQPIAAGLIPFNQSMINVWNWSQNLLDATAQALSWSMPQPLTPEFAMRRSLEKVEAALQDLIQHQEIEIPQHAHYAYTTLEGTPFQFCAVSWLILADQPIQEWALLLILVAQPGKVLPVGIKLQISSTTPLAEATLEVNDLYLYVLVEGNQNEAFTPLLLPVNAAPVTLPAFICHPNSAL